MNLNINLIRILLALTIVIIQFLFWVIDKNTLIFSSMLESVYDVLVMAIIGYSIKLSNKPADETHPFGHWKFANITSISLSVAFIVSCYEIIRGNIYSLKNHIIHQPMGDMDIVMILILIIPTISIILIEKNQENKSGGVLSKLNVIHYTTDFLKIIFLLLDFIITRFISVWWLDDTMSIILMMLMMFMLFPNIFSDIKSLTDHEAGLDIQNKIKELTNGYNVENIRTRCSGSKIVINLDLILRKEATIKEANSLRMSLETNISNSIPNSIVDIYIK